MHFQFSPYIIPLTVAALISGWVVVYAWARRNTAGAIALALLALAITEWSLGYALEIAGTDLATKVIFGKAQYAGIVLTPLMWLIFSFNQANRSRIVKHRAMALLGVIPVVTFIMALTTEAHGLLWKEIGIYQSGNFSALKVTYGVWFWVHSAYSYILLLVGTIIVVRSIFRNKGLYRGQAASLLLAVAVPWLSNALYLSGANPFPHFDPTPFAFTITTFALTLGIFGYRLIDLSPMARDSVIDEMLDGMVVLDTNNLVVDINPSAQTMLGCSAAQAVGQPIDVLFARWADLVERYRGVTESLDEVAAGDENQAWYEMRLSPLHDRRKRLIGRVIVVRDITERKKAETRIAQLSRAVEASPTSIVITDIDGKIQYVNPKFTQVTGYSLEEATGKNPRILKTDQTKPDVHRDLWQTILAGQEWHGEFCNRKKNGELYWESASISPVMDSAGKITNFIAVKEDITQRKRVEEALLLAHDRALEANRLKSQLVAKVSHELRTPLGGILGFAELLHDDTFGPLTDSQKQATGQIIESAHYLDIMVNELLDQAQIEAKSLILHMGWFSPAEVLKKVAANMAVLSRTKGLDFTTSVAPNMPTELYGDEHRLQEILINLTSNAIKFTKKGGVQVELLHPDPSHWAIQVADSGAGIPVEAQTAIFEPFHQLDNAITHENRGTGLGLSITRQLVEMMGGCINLESKIGQGSCFTVLLPIIKGPGSN